MGTVGMGAEEGGCKRIGGARGQAMRIMGKKRLDGSAWMHGPSAAGDASRLQCMGFGCAIRHGSVSPVISGHSHQCRLTALIKSFLTATCATCTPLSGPTIAVLTG